MNPSLAHLPKPPPRNAVEPDASQEQLILLWNAGYQDHEFLDLLGIEQARWLIAKVAADKEGKASPSARPRPRWRGWMTGAVAAAVLIGAAVFYLGMPPAGETAAESGPESTGETETVAATGGDSGPSRIIAPVSGGGFSFSNIGKNVKRLTRRASGGKEVEAPAGKTREGKGSGSGELRVGKEFILRKPVGVRVREGIVVLQPGRPVTILERKGDRVVFRHDFGRAEASISDLVP